jgi:hypothetical protein
MHTHCLKKYIKIDFCSKKRYHGVHPTLYVGTKIFFVGGVKKKKNCDPK